MVTIKETEVTMVEAVEPFDINALGNLFGGRILEWIANVGTVTATRFSKGPAVLAYLDRHFFIRPVRLGEFVILKARVEYTGSSSMEVRIEAWKEGPGTRQELVTITTASFVAVDEYGVPRPLPRRVEPSSDEVGIYEEARARYETRKRKIGDRKSRRFDLTDPTANLRWRVESSRWATPQDAFVGNLVSGGRLLAWLDEVAGLLAARYSGGAAVTGSVDETAFYAPIRVGDIVTIRAGITYVGRSSMEIMLDVIAEGPYGQGRHVCTAYYTYIHVDSNGRPAPVPPYEPSNDYERRLFQEGEVRRRIRDEELARIKAMYR
ncbi:acyl-CoA thioesterase [Vulcanisaeta thermophila]|uniref:acyl-CoA thioesterase n=1 Tax=Vulcanisaeta thermophila TaxID=867917 RepID=UPI000853A795|nr:acyl-CoA thioesterase [Vulcanisaeta thermophila]